MDTTISVLVTGFGTVLLTVTAMAALVTRSIGNLRRHMDLRIDTLTHANQQAHDAIGLRIDAQGADLRERIDIQGADLRERIDTQGAELRERIDTQGAELRGRIDAQGAELRGRIDAQGSELGRRIESLEVRLARTSEDVSFIKGRLTGQPDDGPVHGSR